MGALAGVRVIDFGRRIAGPLTTMLLADQGAEVICVDRPGGPRWKTPANATLNRGKTSVEIDLKHEQGLTAARRLTGSADVVVENFRPGVLERLGIGGGAAVRDHPRLICNPREHSVVIGRPGVANGKRIGHFMVELNSIDDVGFCMDRCEDNGVEIERRLGKHTNDHVVSF